MRITYRRRYYGTKQSAEIVVNFKQSTLGYHVIEALKVAGWQYEGKWIDADHETHFFKIDSKDEFEELKEYYKDLQKAIKSRAWGDTIEMLDRHGKQVEYMIF